MPLSLPDQSLFESLVLARSSVERNNLLSNDDLVFSFDTPCRNLPELGVATGKGGKTVRADHSTFPALVGQGGSITIGFLNPCGFNSPHVHPRAAELNLVVEGRLFASVTAENGATHRNHTLNKFEMTVFPQGAIHTEFNPDCTPAVFVAAFPDEDVS
jgi:mannose-6-phosphate isomerase-like protein (cupin superfamily)